MNTFGTLCRARVLVRNTKHMFDQLPNPGNPLQGYWHTDDLVHLTHRNRHWGRTLFETTDPRGLVHEFLLYREPLDVFDTRLGEMPGRLPEDQYLQVVYRCIGFGSFMTHMSITDPHARKGYDHRLSWDLEHDVVSCAYRDNGSEVFHLYESSPMQQQLVTGLAAKLADLVGAFAPCSRPARPRQLASA